METFEPDFEIIKMDAEVSSYQEDFDGDGEPRDGVEVTKTRVEQVSGDVGS